MNIDFTSETKFEILLEVKLFFFFNLLTLIFIFYFLQTQFYMQFSEIVLTIFFSTYSIMELQYLLQACLPHYSQNTAPVFSEVPS